MKFVFGDIVVVENNLIGVVVRDWISIREAKIEVRHEVYVREYNRIIEYPEDEIERYLVRHKELNEEEIEYQNNAINNN